MIERHIWKLPLPNTNQASLHEGEKKGKGGRVNGTRLAPNQVPPFLARCVTEVLIKAPIGGDVASTGLPTYNDIGYIQRPSAFSDSSNVFTLKQI